MLTQAQLVIELERRHCHVTMRQVRDWRTKGLLPPLVRRGRGQGLGIECYWKDDEKLLSQAMTVCDLLVRRARVESALLGLWFVGYEVDIERARKAWLASLARTKRDWLKDSISRGDCEDALGSLSSRLAKGLVRQPSFRDVGLDWKKLEPLLNEILNACFNPHIDIAIDDAMVDTVCEIMHGKKPKAIAKNDLMKSLRFIHQRCSLTAMQQLISEATLKELSMAHHRWQSILEAIRLLGTKVSGGEIPEDVAQVGRRMSACFGGLCMFGLLSLGRNGMGQRVDPFVEEVKQRISSLTISP